MRRTALAMSLAAWGAIAWANQPEIRNAQVTTEPAQPSLQGKADSIVQHGRAAWIGYEVQTMGGHRNSYNGCGDVRYLESDKNEGESTAQPGTSAILLRWDGQAITRIEVVSSDCHLDAGGVPVHWLTGVKADDSVAYLNGLLTNSAAPKRVEDGALMAISMHEAGSATEVLHEAARSSRDEHLKEQAAFWLGTQRGHDGLGALKELTRDGDVEFRKKLTFDISQNSDPGAVDELIKMAKRDASPDVRGQAIFWLAQKAGKKQAALITDMAFNDPDTAVKKKAVFALSQLPATESYTALVKVAETNHDPAVRKDAIFWLGQNKDPRALEYLEGVLKR